MSQISLKSISGITSITTPTGVDNQLTLHTNDTTQRVKVTQSGIEVVGVATFQDIDVDGHTNLDNVSIAGVTTFAGDIETSKNIVLGDGSDGNASINRLKFGASGDLQIYHNQYHSKIVDGGTGALIISGSEIRFETEPSSTETLRIGSDGTISKYLNSSTVQAAFGGTGQVNGITALPSMAGSPFVVGRDTGTTRSAHFGGHLQFDSGYGIQGTEFSVYGNTSGLYLNSLVSGDNIIFQTHNGSSVGERLRIKSNGYMGVGNFSSKPTAITDPLNVDSGIGTCNIGGNYIHLKRYSGGNTQYINAPQNNANLHISADDFIAFGVDHSSSMYSMGQEALRIHSTGQTQIGGSTLINSDPLLTLGQSASAVGNQFHLVNNGSVDLKQVFISAGKASRHVGIDVSANNFFVGRDSVDSDLVITPGGLIGMGTNNPQKNLHLYTSGVATLRIETGDSRGQAWDILSTNGAGTNTGTLSFRNEAGSSYLDLAANGGSPKTTIRNGGANDLLVVDNNGHVTKPYQPRAFVKVNGNIVLGNGKVTNWASPMYNVGSLWDTTNKRFVAPVNGLYMIGGNFRIGAPGKVRVVRFEIRAYNSVGGHMATYGGGVGGGNNYDGGSSGYDHPYVSFTNAIYLEANQYLELWLGEVGTEYTTYIQDSYEASHLWCVLLQ